MKTYTVIIGIPETWDGISYHRLEVETESQEQAEVEALKAAKEGEADFIGFKSHQSTLHYEDAEVSEIHPWTFQPGQAAMLTHTGPGVYPPTPVIIVKRVVETGRKCRRCGIGQDFGLYPSPWKDRDAYVVEHPTGAKSIQEGKLLFIPQNQ